MPANALGIDLAEVYRNQNALASQQQQQQINALTLQQKQMELQNAPELNALALKKSKLDVAGEEQRQVLAKHAADVKATTDTLGALDAVPDEQLPAATAAARANLQSQGITTAAIDQAIQQAGNDPVKLRVILRQQAQAGLSYAEQIAQRNSDRAFNAGREDKKAEADRNARDFKEKQREFGITSGISQGQLDLEKQKAAQALTAPKLTEDQAKSGGFADRAAEGDAILNDPAVYGAGMNISEQGKARVPIVGNFLVTSDYQKYDQAARNFINATLRRDSGAAISDGEWDNARKQYLPQPGDSEAVLKQKAANRQTVIGSLGRSAGPSYKAPTPPASSDGWIVKRVGS